jgi:hypothetical protein
MILGQPHPVRGDARMRLGEMMVIGVLLLPFLF